MRSAFDHFDASHHENFCAAVLLLAMELDEATRATFADHVRAALGFVATSELVEFGREARLAEGPDDPHARGDLWLLFRRGQELVHALVEVKTHDHWSDDHVAEQVRDQGSRARLAVSPHPIAGCVLLAPTPLYERVRASHPDIQSIHWPKLLEALRTASSAPVAQHAVRHLEAHVDRTTGIADRTVDQFAEAVTTIACLRQFLSRCIEAIGGNEGNSVHLTPADGKPARERGWAWFGIAVSFTHGGSRYRLGIYEYVEAPGGKATGRWLEAYLEPDTMNPFPSIPFNPPSLSSAELDGARDAFAAAWNAGRTAP